MHTTPLATTIPTPHRATRFLPWLASAALLLAPAVPEALAGDASKSMSKSILEPEPKQRFHALINNDFSTHYVTPRGLVVENQGLIWQPIVLLFLNLYSADSGFLTDVTVNAGIWNSVHTRESGANPSNHNELDPIAGINFRFFKQIGLSVYWTAFESQTDSFETPHSLSTKLTWNDQIFGESFAINPYVEFWKELENKTTVVFDPTRSDESFYFQIGINPTYKFKSIPLEISNLSFVNLVDSDFYQRADGSPGGGGAAVYSSQIKFTVPLKFIPKEYGSWSVYAGFKYFHLDNAGVLDGNIALGADGDREKNVYQFHGGITAYF